jgi:hypothetical protein
MTDNALELDIGPVHVNCTRKEIARVFAGMLREVRAAAEHLDETDRRALRFIMSRPNRSLAVSDVFPEFERNSHEHAALRRLRTAQFVLPVGPDKWDRDTVIDTKPFARFLWDRFGEPLLFDETALPAPPVLSDADDAETPSPGSANPFATVGDDDSLNDVIAAITAEHRDQRAAE